MLTRQYVRPLAIGLAVVGGLLLLFGIMYVAVTASNLPSFFPGHLPRVMGRHGHVIPTHAHTKLGLVLLLGSALALAAAWWLAFRYEPVD
jgi:hypothetical protein